MKGEGKGHVRVAETECCPRLAESDLARNLRHILVKRPPEVVVIAENECLFELEPDGDDIPRIFQRKFVSLLGFEFMLEEEFLIIYADK